MAEEKYYKNKNFFTLKVTAEDENLKILSKKFLDDIEKQFINFKNEYEENEKQLEKYLENQNYCFTPEKLTKKSPLTIINAPWGTGKTFFIETFTKYFIDQKLISDIFKKIIIVDAWKFSNSTNVPYDFAYEISSKIINLYYKPKEDEKFESNSKKKKLNEKLFKYISSISFGINLGIFSFDVLKNVGKKDDQEVDADFEKIIIKNETPTIIFIDNIERLGKYSWDLLKCVVKLQEFKNFLIILPMNINWLSNNDKMRHNEYPIDKYIDFHYYNFEQDYLNFFTNYCNNNIDSNLLNSIFNIEIDGEKLSIRDVEKLTKENNLFEHDDFFKKLEIISTKIWPAKQAINNLLKLFVKKYISHHISLKTLYLNLGKKLIEKNPNNNYKYIYFTNTFSNNIISFDEAPNMIYNYKLNFDYEEDFINISDEIKNTKKIYSTEKEKLEDEIKKMIEETEKIDIKLGESNTKLNSIQAELNNFEEEKNDFNSEYKVENHSTKENEKKLEEQRNKVLENGKLENEEKMNKIEEEINFIKYSIEIMTFNMNDFISKFKIEQEKMNYTEYQKEKIDNFLLKNYLDNDSNNWEKVYNIDFDQDDKFDLFFE